MTDLTMYGCLFLLSSASSAYSQTIVPCSINDDDIIGIVSMPTQRSCANTSSRMRVNEDLTWRDLSMLCSWRANLRRRSTRMCVILSPCRNGPSHCHPFAGRGLHPGRVDFARLHNYDGSRQDCLLRSHDGHIEKVRRR